MTQTSIAVTQGTGKNIDAVTLPSTNTRQVVAIGDPSTDAAVAPVSATLGVSVNATAGSAIIGKVGIDQTTPGTTNAVTVLASTNIIGKVTIDETTPGTTNAISLAQIGSTTVVPGGLAGTLAVGGATATNVAITDNPLNVGVQAVSSENSAVTTARKVQLVADLTGKLIVMPYANKENFVSGSNSATGTSGTSVISAQGAGVKIYITSISIANTGANTSLLTIQSDPAGTPVTLWQTISPAGGGSNFNFPTPLVVPANKAVGFTAGTGSTTQYVSICGYIGS